MYKASFLKVYIISSMMMTMFIRKVTQQISLGVELRWINKFTIMIELSKDLPVLVAQWLRKYVRSTDLLSRELVKSVKVVPSYPLGRYQCRKSDSTINLGLCPEVNIMLKG
jgi:hypothetical protein